MNFSNSNILVFDDYDQTVNSGDMLGMPLADYGWATRKVFIVNTDTQSATVVATFNQAVSFVGSLFASVLALLFIL